DGDTIAAEAKIPQTGSVSWDLQFSRKRSWLTFETKAPSCRSTPNYWANTFIHKGGPRISAPTATAVMASNRTAPADTSLATLARSCQSGDIRSTNASTVVLIVSPAHTAPIVR